MYCPKCGAIVNDDAKYCSKCGTSIDDQAKPSTVSERTRSKRHVAPILVMVTFIVGVVVVGIMTDWFGLAGKGGVWVVTKEYKGDKIFEEMEYDANGLPQKFVFYSDGDKSSVSRVMNFKYENPGSGVGTISYTILYTDYDEDGKERDKVESYVEAEVDEDGRALSSHIWTSLFPIKKSSLSDADADSTACIYDEEGDISEFLSKNHDDDGWSFSRRFDEYGYVIRWLSVDDDGERLYNLSYSDDGTPQSVMVDGKEFTFGTDRDGNITAVYNEEGELLRQFEYGYISHPKFWESPRNSVYTDVAQW